MTNHRQKTRRRLPLSAAAAVMVLTGGGLALLIWAKLRLVTGAPRTAYAIPEQDSDVADGQDAADEQQADDPTRRP
jgi:hypothetical protein